jgi:hypothetical protein
VAEGGREGVGVPEDGGVAVILPLGDAPRVSDAVGSAVAAAERVGEAVRLAVDVPDAETDAAVYNEWVGGSTTPRRYSPVPTVYTTLPVRVTVSKRCTDEGVAAYSTNPAALPGSSRPVSENTGLVGVNDTSWPRERDHTELASRAKRRAL